jgi:hypothetical protein
VSTSIDNGTTRITPTLVLGYSSSRQTRNVFHTVVGRVEPDITLNPPANRDGTMRFLFATEAESAACEAMLSALAPVTLTSSERPTINMRFVLSGPLTRTLDPEGRRLWTVEFVWTEVS